MNKRSVPVHGGEASPATTNVHDLPTLAIRRAFNGAVLRAVRPLSVGLALFYTLLAILAVTRVLPPEALRVMFLPWTVSALGIAALAVIIRRRFFRPEWAHASFAGLVAFVLFDSALLMRTGASPSLSVVYVLILLGTAIIVLSPLFYVLVGMASISTWALATWGLWPLPQWLMWFLVLCGASIVGFAAEVGRERTLRRLERARFAAQRLAAIVEASHDAIISIDLEGTILTWNQGASKLYGYREQEAIGRRTDFLVPPHNRTELRYVLDELRRGRSVAIPETSRRASNGDLIPVAVSVAPMRDSFGEVIGGSSVAVDLRPRKELDEERSGTMRRDAELRAAQQLNRLKTDFINVAAHELYTPLTPLKLRIHQLREKVRTQDAQEALATMERSVDRLQSVVDEIVQVAQVQGTQIISKLEPVDLEPLVRMVVDEHRARVEERHQEVTLRVDGRTQIRADRNRLKDALTNILENAVKFTPEGGRIEVWTETSATEAIVGVKDSGPGLEPERLESLLQNVTIAPDYARRKEPGWGFGLFVSRRIIEAHGGKIWAKSEGIGKGSTFFIALPKAGPVQTSHT